jgi:hypothetical protein
MNCEKKNIFGKPNEGIHKHRFLGVAVVDTGMTLIAAILIGYFFKIKWWICFIVLFVVGFILHKMFCVKTAFVKATENMIDKFRRII